MTTTCSGSSCCCKTPQGKETAAALLFQAAWGSQPRGASQDPRRDAHRALSTRSQEEVTEEDHRRRSQKKSQGRLQENTRAFRADVLYAKSCARPVEGPHLRGIRDGLRNGGGPFEISPQNCPQSFPGLLPEVVQPLDLVVVLVLPRVRLLRSLQHPGRRR